MSTGFLVFSLVLSIAVIMLLIIVLKVNPAISLVLGAILLGIMSGQTLMDTINAINTGFGNMLGSIGLPIGFGIILGQLLSDCGGANVIADKLVTVFPEKYALYAIALAGFILSIPVFFDVTFVILIPIGIALMKKLNKSLPYIVGCITLGAGTAHSLVPPTPNPLAAASAEYFNFDLGIMILTGIIIGIFVILFGVTIYVKILDSGLWNVERDETGEGPSVAEMAAPQNPPTFFWSMVPIVLPVVLIIANTLCDTMMGEAPAIIAFLGSKTMSLLCGALAAFLICTKALSLEAAEKSASESLKSAGIVFLITGAGGALSAVISLAGINDAIVRLIGGLSSNVFVVLLIAWLIGVVFRWITGSGTTASLTAMSIMVSMASAVAIHPVFLAMACLDGAMFGCTINDSGFWIVTNMSGFSVTGGAKTYTLAEIVASLIGLVCILAGAGISMLF